MGSSLRLVGVLAAIALAASFGLSMVYNATYEITEEYKRQEQVLARIEALACDPAARFEETVTDSVVGGRQFAYCTAYAGEGSDDVLGYSFVAYGKGYSSTIETIVGVDPAGTISGIKITSQKETPGLGAKVEEVASRNTLWAVLSGNAVDESAVRPWFQTQFAGRAPERLRVVKMSDEDGILAVTGATVSSDAVTYSVAEGLLMLRSIVGVEGDVTDDVAPQGTDVARGAGSEESR